MSRNLPNQVTVARLGMAIVFFVLLAQYHAADPEPKRTLLGVCFWLFVVAGLSDIVDGYLARKYQAETSFGRILDPVVDKVLVCGAFVFFIGPGFIGADGTSVSGVAPWMVVLILGRELLVTSIRGVAESQGTAFGANVVGKLKMFCQSFTAGWVMAIEAYPDGMFGHPFWAYGRQVMIYATVVVTALSIFVYVQRAVSVLRETRNA